jgi:hypothetical protein
MRSACIFSPSRALLGLALVLPVFGCASEGEALEKRLAKLQEEVTRVQSQTDRMAERLDAVELRQATAPRADERVAKAEPTTVARPKLKVVRVESDGVVPDETLDSPPADESGPRVVIQGEGKSVETRSVAVAKSTPAKTEPAKKSESAKKSEPAKAAPK